MKRAIILDTTFMLHYFGIDLKMGDEYKANITELWTKGHGDYNFYLTTISLMEVQYILNGIYRQKDNIEVFKSYSKFLLALNVSKIIFLINPQIHIDANNTFIEIRKLGHTDLMDCWILAAASLLDGIFLTEDITLKKKIQNSENQELKQIPFWNWKKMWNMFSEK